MDGFPGPNGRVGHPGPHTEHRTDPKFETLEQARQAIGDYVTNYHHRPHSRLDYNTPLEVAATWSDPQDHPTPAA
jgi:transposase InsO family protein